MRKKSVIICVGLILAFSLMASSSLAMEYKEAPMLREKVAAGILPPVEERLPKNPLVWGVAEDVKEQGEEPGKYGGMLRISHKGWLNAQGTLGFTRVTADRKKYVPDWTESFEWSPDYKSITFHMREGMKWSDGHPYTADDIMFWWDDLVTIKLEAGQFFISSAGINPRTDKIVKIDDYTIRIDFATPQPEFLEKARGFGDGEAGTVGRCAKHYLKQFHPDYNPKENVSWEEQFNNLIDILTSTRRFQDPNMPRLWPFVIKEYKEGEGALLERNPYFWAVDTEGKQLPYIDYVELDLLSDPEAIKLKILAGECDWSRRSVTPKDFPMIREKGAKVGVEVILALSSEGSPCGIYVNWNHPDAVKRELYHKAEFRRALSLAIDRELINETAYLGLGRPGLGLSPPGVFDPEIDGKYIEYDLERASKMLDELELDKRDKEGYRLLPNGEKWTFTLVQTWKHRTIDTAEIVTEAWRKIGIRCNIKPADDRFYHEILDSNIWDGWTYVFIGGIESLMFKYGMVLTWFADEQFAWWETRDLPPGDRVGIEPKDPTLIRALQLQETARTTTDMEKRQAAIDEYRRLWADQVYVMGTVRDVPNPLAVKKNLKNIWGRKEKWILGVGDEDFWPRSWYWEKGVRE